MKGRLLTILLAAASVAHAQGPWLGGQQEIAAGVRAVPPTVLGLYVTRTVDKNEFGQNVNAIDIRLGWMAWKAGSEIFRSELCTVLETDAQTSQVIYTDRKKTQRIEFYVKLRQKVWITSSGKIAKEQFTSESPFGNDSLDAVYTADGIELSGTVKGKAVRTTVCPPDMELFHARFKPMIKDGQAVLKEKEFLVLDPVTLGVKRAKATISGRFNGKTLQTDYTGWCVEIRFGEEAQKAYISEEDELVRVDLPEKRSLLIESHPPRKEAKLAAKRAGVG